MVVSTMLDYSGVPFLAGGANADKRSGLVCSNLPLTLGDLSASIDRATSKISVSYATYMSTLYRSDFYASSASGYFLGSDIPASSTPVSVSSVKFPVSTGYSLGGVGAWCSVTFTDMTSYAGAWNVNATCLRTGPYGDSLYQLEINRILTAATITSIPSAPQNVVTTMNAYGIVFTFSAPATTGGYISCYEAYATSNGGVSYITQIGTESPIVITGLTVGITYTLSIRAINAKGQSAAENGSPLTITYKLPPDPPTNLVGTLFPSGAVDRIRVTFTPPIYTGGGIDLYYVSAVDVSGVQPTVTASAASSPVDIFGLVQGTVYRFTAYSDNGTGVNSTSTSASSVLYQVSPDAPIILGASLAPSGNPTGIAVSFSAPTNTGGSVIVSYSVMRYNNANGTNPIITTTTGPSSPILVTGLFAGNTYSFRMTATNLVGTSVITSSYTSLLYQTVPDAPTISSIILIPIGNPTGVSVAFTPPGNNGSSTITSYTVTATNGGFTATGTGSSSPISITGLTAGTQYAYTITATSAIGTSAASVAVNSTYKTQPGAPTAVSGALHPTGAATGINVSFTAPANTGGGVDLYYASAIDVLSTQVTVIASSATSPVYLSANLVPGTTYQFTVYSYNAGGQSTATVSDIPLFFQIPPSAPQSLALTLSPSTNPTGIVASFTVPSNLGGGINSYTVTAYQGVSQFGSSQTGTALSYTFTGFTAGTAYNFKAVATNTGGSGVASNNPTLTYYTKPTPATGLSVALNPPTAPTGVNVSFTAASSTGGGTATYVATAYLSGVAVRTGSSTTSPVNITGLTAGSSYTYSIVVNNAGLIYSDTSTATAATLYQTNPSVPQSVSATLSAPNVAVSWAAPASNGGSAIASYRVVSTPAAYNSGLLSASTFSATATGLSNETSYTFTITATNGGGLTSSATSNSVLTTSPPSAPTIGTATRSVPSTATITWSAPASNGGAAITGYRITNSATGATRISASSPYVWTGLSAATQAFKVEATNDNGSRYGAASENSNSIYIGVPGATPAAGGNYYRWDGLVFLDFAYPPAERGGENINVSFRFYGNGAESTFTFPVGSGYDAFGDGTFYFRYVNPPGYYDILNYAYRPSTWGSVIDITFSNVHGNGPTTTLYSYYIDYSPPSYDSGQALGDG